MKKVLLMVLIGVLSVQGQARDRAPKALFAYLKVQPGAEQQFLDAAKEVIVKSRKEPGNLIYILHESQKDPQQFAFYELFKSEADLQAHRNSKHVIDFLNLVKPILVPGQFILDEYDVK